jgi:hypothetical protein
MIFFWMTIEKEKRDRLSDLAYFIREDWTKTPFARRSPLVMGPDEIKFSLLPDADRWHTIPTVNIGRKTSWRHFEKPQNTRKPSDKAHRET